MSAPADLHDGPDAVSRDALTLEALELLDQSYAAWARGSVEEAIRLTESGDPLTMAVLLRAMDAKAIPEPGDPLFAELIASVRAGVAARAAEPRP